MNHMTTTPLSPILPTGEILAITQGYHTNPFAVLGAHPHSKTSMIIRTFQPQATSVFIKTANEEIEMKCIHEAGLYEQVIQCAHPTPYRLRINTPDGQASILKKILIALITPKRPKISLFMRNRGSI